MQLMERYPTAVVVQEHIGRVRQVLDRVPIDAVALVVHTLLDVYDHRQNVYIVGNGGSASAASHFACDLSKATIVQGRPRLRVTSLTDNVALLTAWANDTSYEGVFAEQLANLVNPGDLVIAISASGHSPNVLAAVEEARMRGASTIGLVGFSGGRLKTAVDLAVHVPGDSYGVVEDCHLVLIHAITESVRRALIVSHRAYSDDLEGRPLVGVPEKS